MLSELFLSSLLLVFTEKSSVEILKFPLRFIKKASNPNSDLRPLLLFFFFLLPISKSSVYTKSLFLILFNSCSTCFAISS
ncbi:hypothetical protein C1646_700645 [Rhizophagus diaphanus]|nr:hypothetical protein C1646_700645 [Rhizophagus diaphanus] [Rhizophagus sp. MUCL 43196]